MFVTATIYVNKFLVWHKKFGPAQNILRPVKGKLINHLVDAKLTQIWSNYCPKLESFDLVLTLRK